MGQLRLGLFNSQPRGVSSGIFLKRLDASVTQKVVFSRAVLISIRH